MTVKWAGTHSKRTHCSALSWGILTMCKLSLDESTFVECNWGSPSNLELENSNFHYNRRFGIERQWNKSSAMANSYRVLGEHFVRWLATDYCGLASHMAWTRRRWITARQVYRNISDSENANSERFASHHPPLAVWSSLQADVFAKPSSVSPDGKHWISIEFHPKVFQPGIQATPCSTPGQTFWNKRD